jgi:predicted transcriptional regulator
MSIKTANKARTTTLTMRVPVKLKNRLKGLAKLTERNRSSLAVEAIEIYVDEHELQLAKIDQGILDADAGRLIPHSEVKRYLQAWGTKRKISPPVCK